MTTNTNTDKEDNIEAARVLHVISGLRTGGAETMLYKLLSNSKSSSMVICLGGNENTRIAEDIQALGIEIIWLDFKRTFYKLPMYRKLSKAISKFSPTIIQGWMYHGNLFTLLFKTVARSCPVIWNVRHSLHDIKSDKFLTRVIIKINALLSGMPDVIVYNSNSSASQHERYGYDSAKTRCIPNGFDLKKYVPSVELKSSLRKQFNIGPGQVVIGCVARYHPTKGHDVLLKAAGILAESIPDIKYMLIGSGLDDSNKELCAAISKYNLADHVILLGERNDIASLTNVFDISTSPSLSEAFSNTIGEAMACGVPCVVTNVGDSAWIVGETGLVVPANDAASLASAWEQLIDAGVDEMEKMGIAARQRIEQYFSLPAIAEEYDSLYHAYDNT